MAVLGQVRLLAHRYTTEGLAYRAAALAYATLLSLVPMALIVLFVLSMFPAFGGVGDRLEALVIHNFVPSSAEVIQRYLHDFSTQFNVLPWTTMLFLGFVALLMMVNIHEAFNAIWGVKPRFRFSLSFLMYAVVLVVSPVFLGGVLVLGGFFAKLPYIAALLHLSYVKQPLFLVLPYVVVFIAFTAFNGLLPSCRVRLRDAAWGGLVTTVVFELAKWGFTAYLSHFPTYHLLYGALAVIPIFLVWLYVSWSVILLGALLTNMIATDCTNLEREQ